MQVKELISQFSLKDKLPVGLKEVELALRANGVGDNEEIYYFYDLELSSDSIAGFIHSEEILFGDDDWRTIHTITYAKTGEEMERLVCCKEMLHILDPEYLRARTIDNVERLISEILLPPDIENIINAGEHAGSDRVGLAHAIAVLMPLAAVNLLKPALKDGRISLQRIAELAEIPVFAVAVAMSEAWPNLHERLIARFQRVVM